MTGRGVSQQVKQGRRRSRFVIGRIRPGANLIPRSSSNILRVRISICTGPIGHRMLHEGVRDHNGCCEMPPLSPLDCRDPTSSSHMFENLSPQSFFQASSSPQAIGPQHNLALPRHAKWNCTSHDVRNCKNCLRCIRRQDDWI